MAKKSNKKVVPVDFDAVTGSATKILKEHLRKLKTRRLKSEGILRTKTQKPSE